MIGIFLIFIISIYLINFYKKIKSLPPGPVPLPVIGNLLSVDIKKIHLYAMEQSKKYGDVFTLWLPHPIVVISGYDTIKEAVIKNGDNFNGRNVYGYPENTIHEIVNVGVVFSEGEEWRDQRRLSLQILRNFGMSKTIIQDKIHISISDAINYIDNLQDKDNVDIGRVIYLSIGNVISLILFGSMYKHDNSEEFFNFINNLDDSIKKRASVESKILLMFPIIQKIPFLKEFIYKRIAKPTRKLKELTNQQIELIKKDFDPNNDPPNFIHAVMKEIQAIDSKYSYLNSDHLNGMVLDFWTAGTETTSTTIKWLLLFAMKYLDIQEKLHNEIDEVIGRDHLVLLSDKNRMPYMSAFIAEGQRFANIVPFVPFHKCTIDTVINGRLIPKDTLTQPFFWSANVDEKYFKDPYTFNPNRFLSDDGKKFNPKHDHLSFGLGKRSCVGKSLAEAELFLMFTSLLQKYKFTHINGPVDLSYDFGDVSLVRPYKCKIEKR